MLYKFIEKHDTEWHYEHNDGAEDVIICVNVWNIEEFNKLIATDLYDDDSILCNMYNGYFAFWMRYVCEYNDIDLSDVFEKN